MGAQAHFPGPRDERGPAQARRSRRSVVVRSPHARSAPSRVCEIHLLIERFLEERT